MANETGGKKKPDLNTFGGRVRYVREARGLTVNGLERSAHLGRGAVSRFESGGRGKSVEAETAKRVAEALDVPLEWLIDRTGPDPVIVTTAIAASAQAVS